MISIELKEAGFTDDEIREYLAGKHAELRAAGFSDAEIEAAHGPNPAAPPNPPPFDWSKLESSGDASEVLASPGPGIRTVHQGFGEAIHDAFVQPWINVGYTAGESFNRGSAVFAQHLDTVAEYFEKKTGMQRGGFFESAAKEFNKNADYWKKRADEAGVSFLQELVGSAVGGSVPGISEFMLNVPYYGVLGAAEESKKGGENEVGAALVSMAKRGILGAVFHAMGPLKQYLRAPAMGTVFGIQAAHEGGGPREIAQGVGTGMLYSAASPGGRYGLNEISENLRDSLRKTEKQIEQAKQTLEPPKEEIKEEPKAQEIPEEQAPRVGVEPDLEPGRDTAVLKDTAKFPVQRVKVQDINADPEIFQFKQDVDQAGIQKQLKGEWNELAAGNLLLWESKDGKIFVANGHHRLELAKRLGVEQINAQILKEADGFSPTDARRLAAEANILEGKGTIYDQAEYFRLNQEYTPDVVKQKGLAGQGYAIGRLATDNTYSQFRNRKITPEAAEAISRGAPGDEALQAAGIKYALEHPKADQYEITGLIQALSIGPKPTEKTGDLFGFDDSAIQQAEAQARTVADVIRGLREQINSVRGAAKRPEIARKMGVDVKDPEAIKKKVAELQGEIERWNKWYADPELVRQVKQRAGVVLAEPPRVKQTAPTVEALYQDAEEAYPELKEVAYRLARDFGGEVHARPADQSFSPREGILLKRKESTARKLRDELEPEGHDHTAIGDVIAKTVVFDTMDGVNGALAQLQKDYPGLQVNNKFMRETADGYRDINTKIRLSNGHWAELQLHIRPLYEVKADIRNIAYQVSRELDVLAKKGNKEAGELNDKIVAEEKACYEEALSKDSASALESTAILYRTLYDVLSSEISTSLSPATAKALRSFISAAKSKPSSESRNSMLSGRSAIDISESPPSTSIIGGEGKKVKGKYTDLHNWVQDRNAELREAEKIKDPAERIAAVDEIEARYDKMKDKNWVTSPTYPSKIRVDARRELAETEEAVKTERTEAGEQTVMPGMGYSDTFGLVSEGEMGGGELPKSAPGMKQKGQGELLMAPDKSFRRTPEGEGAPETQPVGRSEIREFLEQKLGLPIRSGRFRIKALGIFKVKEEIVRSKMANDIEVIAHEVGHAIHKFLWPESVTAKGLSSMPFTAFTHELNPLATRPRAGQEVTPEGFAEFIRLYITNEPLARQKAPDFFRYFEGQLDLKAPEVKEIFLEARRRYNLYMRQPALQRVLSQLSVGEGSRPRATFSDLYTMTIDDLHPLELAVKEMAGGEKLAAGKDPYKLARLMRGWVGKAEAFLKNKPFSFKDFQDIPGSKSLKEILKPVEGDLDQFRAYIVSKRALELSHRGIETGILREDAEALVREYDGRFSRTFEDLKAYQDHTLQYLKDAGLLDEAGLVKMRELNKDYVPFYRIMEDTKGKGLGQGLQSRQPIKKIKGSWRDIVDPLESIAKNTFLYINLAEKNAVGRALVDLAGSKDGLGRFVEKIPKPIQRITVHRDELQKYMVDFAGKFNVDLENIPQVLMDEMQIYRGSAFTPKDNVISVWRKGNQELYQVDPEIARVFQALDRENSNLVVKLLSYPAQWLRAGATLTPEFMGRNPLRDQFTALCYSKYGFVPGFDLVRGVFSMVKKDDLYWAWKKGGGDHSMLVSMDRDYLQDNLADVLQKYPVKNLVKNPINALRILSELGEQGTRIGEFKKGISVEGLSKEGMQEAAFSAREVTLDFSRIGAKTKAVNQIIAFWNAQLQGTDRMVRAFVENPLGTSAKVAAAITLPSILLAIANHDDPRYKEIPQWQKDLFWIIPTDRCVYRIPKPFELGILFGTVPEWITHFVMDQDPKAFDNILDTLIRGFSPGALPTISAPIIENWANKSLFFDRPIVPRSREELLPEYQYSEYTTETAKRLGQLVGKFPGLDRTKAASPAHIENLIQGWSGGLGRYALQIADAGLKASGVVDEKYEKPSKTLADIPFVKAFVVRYPSSQAESIERFYQNYEKATSVNKTVKNLIEKEQNPEIALRLWQESGMADLDGIREALGSMRGVIDLVYRNPEMTGDEKRQIIDTIYLQMIQVAKQGNQVFEAYEKARKEAQSEPKSGIVGPKRSEAGTPAPRTRAKEAPAPVF